MWLSGPNISFLKIWWGVTDWQSLVFRPALKWSLLKRGLYFFLPEISTFRNYLLKGKSLFPGNTGKISAGKDESTLISRLHTNGAKEQLLQKINFVREEIKIM